MGAVERNHEIALDQEAEKTAVMSVVVDVAGHRSDDHLGGCLLRAPDTLSECHGVHH